MLDTSVLVAGLRSRRGASFQILSMLGEGEFTTVVSVPLVLESEATLRACGDELGLSAADVDVVVDRMCQVSDRQEIFFLWRPTLRDPGDEFVLELAVGARCDAIVTHNLRDFEAAHRFSVKVMTPSALLRKLRGRS